MSEKGEAVEENMVGWCYGGYEEFALSGKDAQVRNNGVRKSGQSAKASLPGKWLLKMVSGTTECVCSAAKHWLTNGSCD